MDIDPLQQESTQLLREFGSEFYVGSRSADGLNRLVCELILNSLDEAIDGVCNEVDVVLLADGSCRVTDNGRGIPTTRLERYADISALEFVCRYAHSGLEPRSNGIGLAVINAFSSEFEIEVKRDGERHRLVFTNGGHLRSRELDRRDGNGTTVRFLPDPEFFDSFSFNAPSLLDLLREGLSAVDGVRVTFADERGSLSTREWLT